MSVWSLRGIAEFAHFLVQMVHNCPPQILSRSYSVDMTLIDFWQRPHRSNSSLPIPHCNLSLHASGARVAHFKSSLQTGYFIGNVNALQQNSNISDASKSCAASGGSTVMPRAALVKHPNPKFPMLAVHMAFDFGDLCSPLVMDMCSQALVPLHMAHYTGRYKAWLSSRNLLQGSKCRCVTRSGTLNPSVITGQPKFAQSLSALTAQTAVQQAPPTVRPAKQPSGLRRVVYHLAELLNMF